MKKNTNEDIKKRFNKGKKVSDKIVAILIVLILICFIVLIVLLHIKSSVLKNIKNSYSEKIVTVKKAKIYNSNKDVIGSINKGYLLTLKKVNIKDTKTKFFNIKDTKYYIYYKDFKPNKKNVKIDNVNNNYLVFNKNIKTSKKTIFYSNNKKVLSLKEGVNLPIQYIDKDYYYVYFLNNLFQVKKSKSVVEIDNKNTEDKEAEYISVLHFNTIYSNEDCGDDTCIKIDKIKEYVKYLKENGYYSINLDDYKLYLDKNVRLKKNAVFLTTSTNNDTLNNYNKDSDYKIELVDDKVGLKFNNTNNKSTKDSNIENIDRYLIKNNTSDDDFKRMVQGEEIKEIVIVKNVDTPQQSIPVINYHFFYDGNSEACTENICLDIVNFKEQLNYLRDNGYKTLTMDEFTKWMYGQIELPEKSVLLTIDDGAFGTGKHNGNHLIPILEEYKMHATLFLIAGWWDVENYRSKYLDIQSHTFDMHQAGSCGSGQVVCATKEELMADLKKSLEIVDNNNSFCFPFYSYSDLAVETVREVGFKIAFVGGNRQAKRTDNKYLIPRYPIYKGTTLQQFINMVS